MATIDAHLAAIRNRTLVLLALANAAFETL